MMENQVTSIAQSERLLALGIPAEKAAKAFCAVVCADRCFTCIGEAYCKKFNEFKRKMNE